MPIESKKEKQSIYIARHLFIIRNEIMCVPALDVKHKAISEVGTIDRQMR